MWSPESLMKLSLLLLSLGVYVVGQAPEDPINDFCRRFGQQTAVIDSKLYVDGGYVNANPLSQNPQAVINEGLLYYDLNVLNGEMPELFANLSKNITTPDVAGGILWADDVNKAFYLFGGEFSQVPQQFSLWSYDVILGQWNVSTNTGDIQRVAYGAGTTVDYRAEGYYYGGYINNLTTPAWGQSTIATNSLVVYNMVEDSWTNNTGPDNVGRAEGAMVYVPISRAGALIYFGGVQYPDYNDTGEPLLMSTIYLYEIAEGKWYTQTATGDIPPPRRRFCAGVTWAQDQSSYNIYLYGGAGFGENATGFDEVWILTMPGFVWIKWWPTEPGPGNPHNDLTCNVINKAQMLIIGGTFPASDICDAPTVQGTHNLNLGKTNDSGAMWAPFQPGLDEYFVPSEIISVVGGSPTGGATLQSPSIGWNNRDLGVYFTQQAAVTVRSPTRAIPTATSIPHNHKSTSTGTIIGAAVGGGIGAVLILVGLIFFCIRHRRRRLHELPGHTPVEQMHAPPSELPAELYHDDHGRVYTALKPGSQSGTNTTGSVGGEPTSPRPSHATSYGHGTEAHPSSPTMLPNTLYHGPIYEADPQTDVRGQEHPAHAPPRTDYPPPPQAYEHQQQQQQQQQQQHHLHPSQQFQMYPSTLYPTSISNTPANLYSMPIAQSFAAHEASRKQNSPLSPDSRHSPHSSRSTGSGSSRQGYKISDIAAPRPRQGMPPVQSPVSPNSIPTDGSGRSWSYELPTIRSPGRAREMGVNSRAGMTAPSSSGYDPSGTASSRGNASFRNELDDHVDHGYDHGQRGPLPGD